MYRANKTAWMTSPFFEEWFYDEFVPTVKKFLKAHNLPMVATLFIDNCPAHPAQLKVGNIICKFLPANTTSLVQPLDQGVLGQFKTIYRSLMMRDIVSDESKTMMEKYREYNLYMVIMNIAEAWKMVKPEDHQKSWRKLIPDNEVVDFEGFSSRSKACKYSSENLRKFMNMQAEFQDVTQGDFDSWLIEDENVTTYHEKDDDDIIREVLEGDGDGHETSDSESDESCEEDIPEVSLTELSECARKLYIGFSQRKLGTSEQLLHLTKIRDIVLKAQQDSYKQKTITSFFKK